jgi:citrate lyase beta subunit
MSSTIDANPMAAVTRDARAHAESATTWLFVPGDRPDRFDKAATSGADAVIIDLEDAVAPAAKPTARRYALEYVATRPAYIRINGSNTEFFADDLNGIAGADEGLRGIVLPKSERFEQFAELDHRLPEGAVVIALLETPAGILAAGEVATAPRVTRLAFGSADFLLDTEIEDEQLGLLLARSHLVLAARAAGQPGPIDGITTTLDNPMTVIRDAENARRLGFAGKLCIHPRQAVPAARGFAPSASAYAWAQQVIEVAAASNGGAVRVDGEMIDTPRLARARSIAERRRRFAAAIDQLSVEET